MLRHALLMPVNTPLMQLFRAPKRRQACMQVRAAQASESSRCTSAPVAHNC